MRTCPYCAAAVLPETLFCGACGQRIAPVDGGSQPTARVDRLLPRPRAPEPVALPPWPGTPTLPATGSAGGGSAGGGPAGIESVGDEPDGDEPDGDDEATSSRPRAGGLSEEDEATVLASRTPLWRLVTPAGERIPLRSPAVIGRTPAAAADAVPLALVDPSRSLSKTHARLSPVDERIRVEDLGSTNGTIVIEADGVETELGPGQWVELAGPVRLELGEYVLGLERD
ncbi:MAG: FHA domain-containing protein [Microbacteriaceae bacterium]